MSYGGVPYAGGAYSGQAVAAGAAGTFPFVSLEWSPTTGPRATPVWEQIPLADIRTIDINRGRNRELDRYQAGRMTVVLDNRDRTYDPEVDTNVKPMRRIRLRATYGGVTYDLFSGFVDSWDQNYEMTQEATCTVSATDGFKVLERARPLTSVYFEEVAADAPYLWFHLGESANSVTAFNAVDGVENGEYVGTFTFGTEGAIANEPDTAVTFGGTDNADYILGPTEGLFTSLPYTFEAWVKIATIASLGNRQIYLQDRDQPVGAYQPACHVHGTDLGLQGLVEWSSATDFVRSTSRVDNNLWHHMVVTVDSAGAMKLYIDGVLEDTGSDSDVPSGTEMLIGQEFRGFSALGQSNWPGSMDEIAFYNHVLPADRVLAHYNAAIAPWNGDLTGTRIGRILDIIEWPDDEREIDAGQSTLQSADISDTTVLDHAQLVKDTEYGELFMLANGSVRYVGRQNRWLPPYKDSLFTLSDDGADLAYGRLKFNFDDQLIRNRVSVGYVNGVTHTANSTGSQDSYFIQAFNVSGLIGDVDSEGVDYANYILNKYDEPLLRVQGITVTPQRDPDVYFPKVLAADLVYQVNVERTPQGSGSPIDINYTIEGISHRIEPKFWRTDLMLSPADTPGAFILNSTSQGILDTNALGW